MLNPLVEKVTVNCCKLSFPPLLESSPVGVATACKILALFFVFSFAFISLIFFAMSFKCGAPRFLDDNFYFLFFNLLVLVDVEAAGVVAAVVLAGVVEAVVLAGVVVAVVLAGVDEALVPVAALNA